MKGPVITEEEPKKIIQRLVFLRKDFGGSITAGELIRSPSEFCIYSLVQTFRWSYTHAHTHTHTRARVHACTAIGFLN